jgi:hypothetical protein
MRERQVQLTLAVAGIANKRVGQMLPHGLNGGDPLPCTTGIREYCGLSRWIA